VNCEDSISIDNINSLLTNNVQYDSNELLKSHWTGPKGESAPSQGLKKLRQDIGVVVKSLASSTTEAKNNLELCPAPVKIDDENIPLSFMPILNSLSITALTTVQMQCWPAILSGANILAYVMLINFMK